MRRWSFLFCPDPDNVNILEAAVTPPGESWSPTEFISIITIIVVMFIITIIIITTIITIQVSFVRSTGGSSKAPATCSGFLSIIGQAAKMVGVSLILYLILYNFNLKSRNQELFPGELVTTLYKVSEKYLTKPKAEESTISLKYQTRFSLYLIFDKMSNFSSLVILVHGKGNLCGSWWLFSRWEQTNKEVLGSRNALTAMAETSETNCTGCVICKKADRVVLANQSIDSRNSACWYFVLWMLGIKRCKINLA